MYDGRGDEEPCNQELHDVYNCVFGSVAWTMLIHADVLAHVQAPQRRGANPWIKDCKQCSPAIRHLERHRCCFGAIKLQHPVRLMGFIDADFKASVEEPTGLILRGLAASLSHDDC